MNAMIKTIVRNNIVEGEKIVHIYSDIDNAVNSFHKDSDNPMKKAFIESAVSNGCTAYNNYWNESSVIISKEAMISLLKTMTEEDIGYIFDSVIESKSELKKEPEVKEKRIINCCDTKKFIRNPKRSIFNNILKLDPERLIICKNKKFTNNITKSNAIYTYFNLYKENDEKLRLIVYKEEDKEKKNPYPTNLFFDKEGNIYFYENKISLNDKSIFIKVISRDDVYYSISTNGIKISVKSIFGRGFVNKDSIYFYYKDNNYMNNSYSNIIAGKKKYKKGYIL